MYTTQDHARPHIHAAQARKNEIPIYNDIINNIKTSTVFV